MLTAAELPLVSGRAWPAVRTVETHVSRIYAKLGGTSRARGGQLAGALS